MHIDIASRQRKEDCFVYLLELPRLAAEVGQDIRRGILAEQEEPKHAHRRVEAGAEHHTARGDVPDPLRRWVGERVVHQGEPTMETGQLRSEMERTKHKDRLPRGLDLRQVALKPEADQRQ